MYVIITLLCGNWRCQARAEGLPPERSRVAQYQSVQPEPRGEWPRALMPYSKYYYEGRSPSALFTLFLVWTYPGSYMAKGLSHFWTELIDSCKIVTLEAILYIRMLSTNETCTLLHMGSCSLCVLPRAIFNMKILIICDWSFDKVQQKTQSYLSAVSPEKCMFFNNFASLKLFWHQQWNSIEFIYLYLYSLIKSYCPPPYW